MPISPFVSCGSVVTVSRSDMSASSRWIDASAALYELSSSCRYTAGLANWYTARSAACDARATSESAASGVFVAEPREFVEPGAGKLRDGGKLPRSVGTIFARGTTCASPAAGLTSAAARATRINAVITGGARGQPETPTSAPRKLS